MEKTIRFNPNPEEQQSEAYRYWQGLSIGERFDATEQLSIEAYQIKRYVEASERLRRDRSNP